MNGTNEMPRVTAPWHVWVVGVIALLWNSVGAFDYTMTEMRNAAYMKAFTPEQVAYFYGFPTWVVAAWALSVWGGVLGSLALLRRKRWAVPIFAISLATMALTFVDNFVLSNGIAVMGGAGALVFPAVILMVGIALLVYSRSLARKGILR
jgi:hypothetical protein